MLRPRPIGVFECTAELQQELKFPAEHIGRWGFLNPVSELHTFDTEEVARKWYALFEWRTRGM